LFYIVKPNPNTMTQITVQALVNAPLEKVWDCWTEPAHIVQWTFASDEWHSPLATNDLRIGGRFNTRMEAKDGSVGFDFEGVYTAVTKHQHIHYELEDNRQIDITFEPQGNQTLVTETFDAETENPEEMQRGGWQAILNNFKKYTESV
jgi:uncharacterized protein YndB with AHSA1/START domain